MKNASGSASPVSLSLLALCAACSGGGGSVAETTAGGRFVVQGTEPRQDAVAYLNDPVQIDFSNPVDLGSAGLDAIAFDVFAADGRPLAETVAGEFTLTSSPGDEEIGRRLVFSPRLPSGTDLSQGGFRPGRRYVVRLVGGDRHNGMTLLDQGGRALDVPSSFSFRTVEGTSAAQLFRNPKSGGPRRAAHGGLLIPAAATLDAVPLGRLGAPALEVWLRFDQPLDPRPANVPVAVDLDPATRSVAQRGRIWLEYDDPERGAGTWLPAEVELEANDAKGSVVVLRPLGVLPNAAVVRVMVAPTLADVAGEDNTGDPGFQTVFGTFTTAADHGQQFAAVVETFAHTDAIDAQAVFAEPMADVGPGYLRAGFDFDGRATTADFEPTVREVVLNTAFTQVVPKAGLAYNVSGGVFHFRNVHIPQGVVVRGLGPNPMVWVCNGEFRVDGELTVRGGNGSRVDTLNSANYPKAGGVAGCGGGDGGDGSPSGIRRDQRGGNGSGGGQTPGQGGAGGRLSCLAGCAGANGGGSGGGGGTLATQGDPFYRAPAMAGTAFQQRRGIGGTGCSGGAGTRTATLAGGEAAPMVFRDAAADNDFWGAGIDYAAGRRVVGELAAPLGGGGGGGGGDNSASDCTLSDPNFASDNSGGGGGGGGGVLIVKALGDIVVGPTGKIVADGGHGGGGEQAGSCNRGGGGGGGSGGMVVLMSARRIVLHAHGSGTRWTYGQSDYDFAISADGGVCTTGTFTGPVVRGKYPSSGQPMTTGNVYDDNPLGGMGGMGIVQLMAPPGVDNLDGTNTRLDDNIEVLKNGVPTSGAEKQAMLAWRGFAQNGTFVDDQGVPIALGADEGDIRPSPILLPSTFGPRSRVRSKWIDTGASQRRPLAVADGAPRGLVLQGGAVVGPTFSFHGADANGYVAWRQAGSDIALDAPQVIAPVAIAAATGGHTIEGLMAHRLELAAPALGTTPDRYSHFEAELLLESGEALGGFRILAHGAQHLLLDATDGPLPNGAVRMRVMARGFGVTVDGVTGLGAPRQAIGGAPEPAANVRFGFAFHQDPRLGNAGRYPTDPTRFVRDLEEPGLQAWVAQHGAPRFVMWDVEFDMAPGGAVLGPLPTRPEVRWLRLPFRF